MHDIEPFFGWLDLYSHDMDPNNPFHEVRHSEFYYDRQVYNYLAHPQWDDFGSESLLVKILYADYDRKYAILELFGVWNDLFENDWKLLAENCLTYLIDAGINQFIFITENVLSVYPDADDYYEAVQEELGNGWMCLIRPRDHVRTDLTQYGINRYFFWSDSLDDLSWRKLKPWELQEAVTQRMANLIE